MAEVCTFKELPFGGRFRFVHGSGREFVKVEDKRGAPTFKGRRSTVRMAMKGWQAECVPVEEDHG